MDAFAAAQAEEAEALLAHLGPAVLLNDLLFAQIWGFLDADDKRQLRSVGRGVRALADGSVVTLTMRGEPAIDLASALARWPNVTHLSVDCDVHSVAVLRAAPLPKLKALVLEHRGVSQALQGSLHALRQ